MAQNTPTNPTLWATAQAKAVTKFGAAPSAESVGWANKWYQAQGGAWTPVAAKTAGANANELLRWAGISALTGAGIAGLYGLARHVNDEYVAPKEMESIRAKLLAASGVTPAELEAAEPELESIQEKTAMDVPYSDALTWGLLAPLAVLPPGFLAYHFTKKYIDRNRKNKLDNTLADAKQEFETVLSEKTSALQSQLDDLYLNRKQAGIVPSWMGGSNLELEKSKGTFFTAPYTDVAGDVDTHYGPALSMPGAAWFLGSATGLAALTSYLMSRRNENDVEQKKVKALKSILKKNLSATALESGVGIRVDANGNKIVEI